MITAAHFEFTKNGVGSIHNVSRFLKMCGLEPFVGTSYSSQRRVSQQMDENIIDYGEIENERLGKQIRSKSITICEDETFHPQICLVGIEPSSGYILLEEYAKRRDAETWNKVVSEAIKDLPVKVIQMTGDEASGLKSHAKKGFRAHHSSDLFHVVYEIGKGTSAPLTTEIKKAEKNYEKSIEHTRNQEKEKRSFDEQEKRGPGRRPHFEKRIKAARTE